MLIRRDVIYYYVITLGLHLCHSRWLQCYTTASIWFEIWVVVDPSRNILIFPGKFPTNFEFFRASFPKISIFQAKILDYLLLVI